MKFAKYAIVALLTSIFFAACYDEGEDYVYAPLHTSPDSSAYFPDADNFVGVYGIEDSVSTVVYVKRQGTKEKRTVGINLTTVYDGLVKSYDKTVTFEAGKDSAEVKVILNKDAMKMFKSYEVFLSIVPPDFHPYKVQPLAPSVRLSFLREDYQPYAKGTFNDPAFAEGDVTRILEYSELQQAYRIKDPWSSDNGELMFRVENDTVITYLTPEIFTGATHNEYGKIYAYWKGFEKEQLYDPKNNVYHFYFDVRVKAGSFGKFPFTFTVEELLKKEK